MDDINPLPLRPFIQPSVSGDHDRVTNFFEHFSRISLTLMSCWIQKILRSQIQLPCGLLHVEKEKRGRPARIGECWQKQDLETEASSGFLSLKESEYFIIVKYIFYSEIHHTCRGVF